MMNKLLVTQFLFLCAFTCYAGIAISPSALITNGSPVRVHVPIDDNLGTNWVQTGFDDSTWISGLSGVGFETNAVGYISTVLADSDGDWESGAMGQHYWLFGYYNRTADSDGVYQHASDFNYLDPNWGMLAGAWNLGLPGNLAANPPWTRIGRQDVHPSGASNGAEHWPMRRWISTYTGDVTIEFHLRKANVAGGGISGKIFHNGAELFSQAIAGNDQVGFRVQVNATLSRGDVLDFAQTPVGLNGTTNDGSDSGILQARILSGTITGTDPLLRGDIGLDVQGAMRGVNSSLYTRFPFTVNNPSAIDELTLNLKYNDGYIAYLNGLPVSSVNEGTRLVGVTHAESIADWGNGSQGTNNWFHGYYNFTQDGDGLYGANDFNTADTNWTFIGAAWNLGVPGNPAANPPWSQLGQEAAHPNGANNGDEQWVIRRWMAELDGDLSVRVRFRKQNVNCGGGVGVRVFHNGVELYNTMIAGNDGVGRDDLVELPGVFIGDTIDIALTPLADDSCDGTYFSAEIFVGELITGWDAIANEARTTRDSFAAKRIDLTAMIPTLIPGANVLAIHGMNIATNDDNFLLSPTLIANHFPVEGPDALTVMSPDSGSLAVTNLLATDLDPDGDALVFLGADPASVQGGTVVVQGDAVVYTPPAGITGADSFAYQFSDGSGMPVSGTVNVTIEADSTSPFIVGASLLHRSDQIVLNFSEPMDEASTTNLLNYSVENEFAVIAVTLSPDGQSARLTLDRGMNPGTTNCLTVSLLEDVVGNVLDPNPAIVCVPVTFSPCFARSDFWLNVAGSAVSNLTNLVTFPYTSDTERYETALEITSNQNDGYGVRISGWLRPPVSGNYHFAMSSDDNGSFSLSSDLGTANLVELCWEPLWHGPRDWTGTARRNAAAPENLSATLFPAGIALVGGEYYTSRL
jgi:hypothetical protein